jgi:hypothetical protein
MKEDIQEYINENYTNEDLKEKLEDSEAFQEELNDDLWVTDSVTGNASGSYTFNRYIARDYVIYNIDLLSEAIQEFCIESETVREKFLNEEWEYFDVTIRCYILSGVISEVLEELQEVINND